MANNNVQNVRFLRNGTLFTTRDAALAGLNGQTLAEEQDGSIILARYGSGNAVKTLVGLVYVNGGNKSLTIFDIEGASSDVEALRTEINNKLGTGITSANTATAQLAALSGSASDTSATTSVAGAKAYTDDKVAEEISKLDQGDTAQTGYYVSQVSQADGKISVSRVALPDASTVSGESKVVTEVTQTLGQITATASNLTGVKLDGYAEAAATGDVASTDTLGQALGKLQKTIHEMDKDADAVAGQVVTTVSEANGVVSETKANVKDLQLGGYEKNASAIGDIASTDTINAALSKLENKAAAITIANDDKSINVTTSATGTNINVNIKSGEHVLAKDGNAGLYTNIALSSITPSSTTVKEEYQLTATDGTKLGDSIKIYKDSSLVSIEYITDPADAHYQNLEYVYVDNSGNTQTEYVDMSSLVLEAEFESGVTADASGVVHGVVDPTSEKVALTYDAQGASATTGSVLTVDANGFKVSNVQTAIDAKVAAEIGKLDATGGTQTIATDKHVAVEVIEADGKITTVTVTEDDIASAQGLADEITARTSADTELSNRLGTGVTTANTATAQLAALSGNTASTSGETSVEGAKRYADAKLADVVGDLDATVTGATSGNHVTITIEEVDGKLVQSGLTIEENDIASASALTAETAARKAVDGQTGDTYAANTGSSYIDSATSLNDADVKLAAALESLDTDVIKGVKVNGSGLTETNNEVNIQISSVPASGTEASPIIVNTDSTGAVTLQILQIDCGTY